MRSIGTTALIAALFIAACTKDGSPDVPVEDVYQVVDHAYMERALVPLPALIGAMRIGSGPWAHVADNTCATLQSITGDTTAFPAGGPVTIQLLYPVDGCSDVDQHIRAGTLSITLTDLPSQPGAQVWIHSADLRDGEFRYRFWITDSIINADTVHVRVDSSFIYREGAWGRRLRGDALYTLSAGGGDTVPTADAWSIVHSFSGGDRYGAPYDCSTLEALEFRIACPWITQGQESLDPADFDPRTLDYGDGVCDPQLDFQAEDQSFGLTIP